MAPLVQKCGEKKRKEKTLSKSIPGYFKTKKMSTKPRGGVVLSGMSTKKVTICCGFPYFVVWFHEANC